MPNNLQRDFILPGASATFALDVPNGTYSVKTYSGDWIGSTRTDFALEGRAFGSGNAGRGAVNESVRGPVLVTDGQLNITASGAAAGTRLNGLEITPILLGPVGLAGDGCRRRPRRPDGVAGVGCRARPDLERLPPVGVRREAGVRRHASPSRRSPTRAPAWVSTTATP